ncbi:MAG: helix-turn-helix domain-containing protein [Tannerellaceae bacterium]|nr:helix-turn-helix domain-containing protein [Tannerellaceae bacterium]
MKYQIISPSDPLKPFVSYYWVLETEKIINETERILPTGYMQLIFYRANRAFSHTEKDWQPRTFIGGQTNTYNELTLTGTIKMIAVSFHPYGARAFFNLSMLDFLNRTIPVDCMGDKKLEELEEKIMDTEDIRTCILLIEAFLLKRLITDQDHYFKRLQHSLLMAKIQPETKTFQLASASCFSTKQYKRIFNEYVGINPKEFLRILRFQRTLHILHNQPSILFTDLAFQAGYYDQAHLTKEFKRFSGYMPTQYKTAWISYSDYFADSDPISFLYK